MSMLNGLNDVGVFTVGMPIEDRPIFKDWLVSQGAKGVVVIKMNRALAEYDERLKQYRKHLFVVPEQHSLSDADLRYIMTAGAEIATARRVDTDFILTPLDVAVELARKSEALSVVDERAASIDEITDRILFSAQRDPGGLTGAAELAVPKDDIEVTDITMVICIRAHASNPWAIDRLKSLRGLYRSLPRILIVDFGSELTYSEVIEDVCEREGFDYHFVDDRGVFALAKARNIGASLVKTDLIFFSDIDFCFTNDFFERLARRADALAAKTNIDVVLMCSALHLSQNATAQYVSLTTSDDRSALLSQIGFRSVFEPFGNSVQYVAPYSNVFLINKTLFSLSGGYDERFRGHGSEDFEFILRLNYYTSHFPKPERQIEDIGGPMKQGFFKNKRYAGFRAVATVTSLPGQMEGLRAYHLYHPTPEDSWRVNNDWRRERFQEVVESYQDNPERVLQIDYIKRPKKALCVCMHQDQWGYFLPLRLAGYEIIPLYDGSISSVVDATKMIASGQIDAFVIFNPYMQSHRRFQGLFYLAKKHCETIVIERGALPGTIYYSDDVAYTSASYADEAFSDYAPTEPEEQLARRYVQQLRRGGAALEQASGYDLTMGKYAPLAELDRKIVFLPLQMAEDMAVTMFIRDAQKYDDYAASINDVAARNPNTLFIIKPHPLTKGGVEFRGANIIVADREDNVHALIDLSSAVVCYNSGVALLAMAHMKPVVTVGNAYFNRGGAGAFADSLGEAVEMVQADMPVNEEAIIRVYSWLLNRMYSEFTATDDVREFQTRKAHGYKDIVVTTLRLNGETYNTRRIRASSKGAFESLGFALLNYTKPDIQL